MRCDWEVAVCGQGSVERRAAETRRQECRAVELDPPPDPPLEDTLKWGRVDSTVRWLQHRGWLSSGDFV